MLKRTFDLCVVSVLVVVLAPLLLALTMFVATSVGWPVIFRHRRPGLHGEPFTLYKFRTMTNELDAVGRPLPDSQRLTPSGRLLRRWSLDELPEFYNVLKGDMSLVGPRPLLMGYLPHYTSRQRRRHEVKPGLTGWAQVNGRNSLDWEERFELDVWYVDHQSFTLDMKILLATLQTVLRREGITHPGSETMPRFQGSSPAPENDEHA